MKKKLMHVLLVLILCSLVLVLPTAAAVNEKIAFGSEQNSIYNVYVMNSDERVRLLSPPIQI